MLHFGALHPCGILQHEVQAQLARHFLNDLPPSDLAFASKGVGLLLATPMIEAMVKGLTTGQCLQGLWKLWIEGEQIYTGRTP